MTSCGLLAEGLRALAPDIARHDSARVAESLSPWLGRLREPLPTGQAKEAVDAVSVICRALYDVGRAAEAIPLARELLGACRSSGDMAQVRRAAGVCGLLSADSWDLVGAIEYHVQALRLATREEDRVEMGRTWVLIGSAIRRSGRHDLAARCFRRTLGLLEPVEGPSWVRFSALGNLADVLNQFGDHEQALALALAAHREAEAAGGFEAPGEILLRRTLVRVLIALERHAEAAPYVEQAAAICSDRPSVRSAMAVEMMRAALELATGRADLALSRLDRTIARAREVPSVLQDALGYAVRAEEAAGNPARALTRLQELCDLVYGRGIEQTRKVLEAAGMNEPDVVGADWRDRIETRLASQLEAPAAPPAWAMLRRLGVSAVLPMDDTGFHGVRVHTLVRALALKAGCTPLQSAELGLAAELHDIGLASVPEGILAKQGPLNDSERAAVRRHHEGGAAMLLDDRHPRLLIARDVARYHHARWDGMGYPARVGGTAIPLGARLCAVADAYDAMVCGLGGRSALTMEQALFELKRESGGQFDPQLVSSFDAVVKGELEALGLDLSAGAGMDAFRELILSLKEDRGFI